MSAAGFSTRLPRGDVESTSQGIEPSANGRRDDTRRVVVTGMGVVTPIGETPAEFSASLRAGRSGITRWKHMDERTLSKIGGDMCEFDLAAHLERVGAAIPPT